MLSIFRRCLLVACLAVWAAGTACAQETEALAILTKDGKRHEFVVEVARTDATREQGLMFRQSLAPMHGMLFEFGAPRQVAMWMRNTYISLDMVFIRKDGVIVRVAERTEPLSERIIRSEEEVTAVLEIGGGEARRLGVSAGDKVEHSYFQKP